MCLPLFGNKHPHHQNPDSLSFSVSALHNGFFVLAKIKRNAKTVTDHLGRLYECSVKTAGFPNILYSIGRYFAL